MKAFGEVPHGTAVWTMQVFENMDAVKATISVAGHISGDRLCQGYDIDEMMQDVWADVADDTLLYLEFKLMLCSGQVVRIASHRSRGCSEVNRVDFDQSEFPSGLMGRWVDHLVSGERQNHGKEGVKKSRLRGRPGSRGAVATAK